MFFAAACSTRKAATCRQRSRAAHRLSPAGPVRGDNLFEVCAGAGAARPLQVNDASSNADRDGLRAILRAELVHDVPDVDLDGFFRDREALADIAVAVP